jgi:rhamnogalacturonyl hydrolase YesR
MRDHLAKLEKGPTVEGRACAWLHTSNAAVKNTMDNAYADAIQKAGPQYDALTNMDLTRTFYPLFFACNDVRGTATKNKTYSVSDYRR